MRPESRLEQLRREALSLLNYVAAERPAGPEGAEGEFPDDKRGDDVFLPPSCGHMKVVMEILLNSTTDPG